MQNSNLFYNKNVKNYKFNEINYSKSNLKNRLLNELYHETVPVMLEEDDSNSMLHSIENRSPYLNYNLVKYIQSIKPKYFINNGFTKFILREIGNNILDDKIRLSKNKKGFNTNLNSLININKKEIIDFITAQKNIDEFINLKNLKNTNFKQLNNSNNKNIFNIINVCVFLNKFN
jgi:asparagine synthase (glutamine-hydrolysing)